MKKIFAYLTVMFIAVNVLGQIPEKMIYQEVVCNGKNTLVTNQPIGLRLSIIQGAIPSILA